MKRSAKISHRRKLCRFVLIHYFMHVCNSGYIILPKCHFQDCIYQPWWHFIWTLINAVISLCLCPKGSGKSWYTSAGLRLLCCTTLLPVFKCSFLLWEEDRLNYITSLIILHQQDTLIVRISFNVDMSFISWPLTALLQYVCMFLAANTWWLCNAWLLSLEISDTIFTEVLYWL